MSGQISTQEAIEAWKLGHRFVLDVYRLTNKLPSEEHYGLTPKIRTSSVKIASNIVEGYARKSNPSYLQHLTESQVALEETKYSLLVARDLGYISEHKYNKIMNDAEELSERLDGLQQRLSVSQNEAGQAEQSEKTPLFGTTHSVRESLADAWAWFMGGRDRLKQRRAQREPQVWVEDPTRHYLDAPE